MFSDEERCLYHKSPLIEVICQLRFPTILSIDNQDPYRFQEMIRADYPQYAKRTENLPPKNVNGKQVPQGTVQNYQFVERLGHWKVNLTQNFISLSTNQYTRWEDFANRLDKILAAFIQMYSPAYFERVGLRFVNSFSRSRLELEDYQWRDLIQPGFLGLLAEEDVREQNVMGEGQRYDIAIPGGCRAKIHAAPAMMKKRNVKTNEETQDAVFILDQDIYMTGQIAINHSAGALQTVHLQADRIFRGAVTDVLHQAMDPQIL